MVPVVAHSIPEENIEEEKIVIFSLEQGDLDYHCHDFLELVYITEGRGLHYLDGVCTEVKQGDYFIIDYESRHKYERLPGVSLGLINCLFRPVFINPSLKNCRSFPSLLSDYLIRFGNVALNREPTRCIYRDEDGRVRAKMQRMQEEYEEKQKGYLEILRGALIELLIVTMRKILDETPGGEDPTVSAMVRYIETNFDANPRLAAIAEELRFSPQYLSVRFKETVGTSFVEYLQRYRVSHACRLLAGTDKKLMEIAEACGYGDVKFFHRVFKKYMGTTPGEFRRGIQGPRTLS